MSLVFFACPGLAGTLVDPGGLVEDLVADPVRNVFYASLETDEVVIVSTSGSVTTRVSVPDDPHTLAVSTDGSKLYVTLATTNTVAEYDLPGLTFSRNFTLSDVFGFYKGMVAKPGRLYLTLDDSLSIVDTATGAEIYNGEPGVNTTWWRLGALRLSPDGKTLYAMNFGLSPVSLYVFDVTTDVPKYIGEDCCHTCHGGNGQAMQLSADGNHVYMAVGGQYHLQVLSAAPLLHDKFAGLTGPYPNAVAPSANGERVYVGYSDSEFAVVRTSDWLPYHVGDLQGDVVARGLALSSNQQVLAAVIEFTSFDPDRIELINVGSLVANRGGIRLRPLDDVESVPINGARIQDPVFEGNSAFFDVANGLLGRAPIEPDTFDTDISAPGHATVTRTVTVSPGTWTDLGDLVLTRTGDMPDPDEVCGSPAAEIGRTKEIDITGRGFFPGAALEVTTTDPDITIDTFTFENWSTIRATVTVAPSATPGLSSSLKVTNPDGGYDIGALLRMYEVPVFADGFESGDVATWSSSTP